VSAPRLLVMKGHPATGKSELAYRLARRLRCPLIDKDDVKDYTLSLPDGNVLAYAIMWQVAGTQLALGLDVVVDSPLSYPIGYTQARELAARHAARLWVIETQLDEAEWRRRLDARPPEASTHKMRGWAAMQELLRQYDGCWQYPIAPEHHIVVDTALPVEELLRDVLARIRSEESEAPLAQSHNPSIP
jgi:predicted kinase